MSSSSAKEKKIFMPPISYRHKCKKKATLRPNNKNINYDNNIRNIFNNALN